ncbi:MAG: hypothetical protein D6690_14825 [Nitrospirae bacterium]|nr:MAG: hypothetical protein D6690_14825 [Nitrospirota bacterium]
MKRSVTLLSHFTLFGDVFRCIKRKTLHSTADRIVGLDLAPTFLAMVELDCCDYPVVSRWATRTIEGVVGAEADESRFRSVLSEFVRQHCLDRARTVVGMSGPGIYVKVVSVPRMSFEELKAHLNWEIDHYLPYGPEDMYWDAHIQGGTNEAHSKGSMSVVVAAAKKDLVDRRMALLEDVGLQPEVIDIDGLALSHLWDYISPHLAQRDGATLWVNCDPFRLSMTVLHCHQLVAVRDARFELWSLEPTFDSSITNSSQPAVDGNALDCCPDTSLSRMRENIVREIRRTMHYNQNEDNPAVVTRLLLSGAIPDLAVLSDALRTEFDFDVQVVDPFRYFQRGPQKTNERATADPAAAAIATGLALRLGAA